MVALPQRRNAIQMRLGGRDHRAAARSVVAYKITGGLIIRDRIAAIEGIEQTAPTGVGGIEGKTGVHQWHHQLGAC